MTLERRPIYISVFAKAIELMVLEFTFISAPVHEINRALPVPKIVFPLASVDLTVKVDHPATTCLLVSPVPAFMDPPLIEHRAFAVLSTCEVPFALVNFLSYILELPFWFKDSLDAVRGWRRVIAKLSELEGALHSLGQLLAAKTLSRGNEVLEQPQG